MSVVDAAAGVPDAAPRAAASAPELYVCLDLPCRQCGYNLRTLAMSAVCPECGGPVAANLADQGRLGRWLENVVSAAQGLLLCGLLVLLVLVGMSFAVATGGEGLFIGGAAHLILFLLVSVFFLIPFTLRPPARWGGRMCGRVALRAALLLIPISAVGGGVLANTGLWPVGVAAGAVCGGSLVLLLPLLVLYCGRLLDAAGERATARVAVVAGWVVLVLELLLFVLVFESDGSDPILAAILSGALLVLGIVLSALWRTRCALRAYARRLPRDVLAAEPAP